MTPFRLATATVLLAGLALPALAQGTPATGMATAPAASHAAALPPTAARTAATPAATPVPMAQALGTPATPGVITPVAPRAESGATETRTVGTPHAARTERRSHHRLASAARPETARTTSGTTATDAPR